MCSTRAYCPFCVNVNDSEVKAFEFCNRGYGGILNVAASLDGFLRKTLVLRKALSQRICVSLIYLWGWGGRVIHGDLLMRGPHKQGSLDADVTAASETLSASRCLPSCSLSDVPVFDGVFLLCLCPRRLFLPASSTKCGLTFAYDAKICT